MKRKSSKQESFVDMSMREDARKNLINCLENILVTPDLYAENPQGIYDMYTNDLNYDLFSAIETAEREGITADEIKKIIADKTDISKLKGDEFNKAAQGLRNFAEVAKKDFEEKNPDHEYAGYLEVISNQGAPKVQEQPEASKTKKSTLLGSWNKKLPIPPPKQQKNILFTAVDYNIKKDSFGVIKRLDLENVSNIRTQLPLIERNAQIDRADQKTQDAFKTIVDAVDPTNIISRLSNKSIDPNMDFHVSSELDSIKWAVTQLSENSEFKDRLKTASEDRLKLHVEATGHVPSSMIDTSNIKFVDKIQELQSLSQKINPEKKSLIGKAKNSFYKSRVKRILQVLSKPEYKKILHDSNMKINLDKKGPEKPNVQIPKK